MNRSMRFVRLSLPLILLTGCVASKDDLKAVQSDMQNNAVTSRKEIKGEIEAAKKQLQEETQQAVQKLKTEIDNKAIKALSDQREKIDAMNADMKSQDEALTKDVQQLKQQNQQLVSQVESQRETLGKISTDLKEVQDRMTEMQKINLQVLHEFQALRDGVQVTYGGVLDYLRIEEALLKSSLQRVQTILQGVQHKEITALPSRKDSQHGGSTSAAPAPSPAPQSPPPAKSEASPAPKATP